MLLSFFMTLFDAFFLWGKTFCVALSQPTANAKRITSLDYLLFMTKYTPLFMNAIGLISSDIKWVSQREEWLFYSLSQLVKDVKLAFTVWAEMLTWCSIALVCQLIHMHPIVSTAISVCFWGRGWGGSNAMGREMSTGPSALCVFYVFYLAFDFKYLLLLVLIPGLC